MPNATAPKVSSTPFATTATGPTGKAIKSSAEARYLAHLATGKSQAEAANFAGLDIGVAKGITKRHGGLTLMRARGRWPAPRPTPVRRVPTPIRRKRPGPVRACKGCGIRVGNQFLTKALDPRHLCPACAAHVNRFGSVGSLDRDPEPV